MNEDKFTPKRGRASVRFSPMIFESASSFLATVGIVKEQLEQTRGGFWYDSDFDTDCIQISEDFHDLEDEETENRRSLGFVTAVVRILEEFDEKEDRYSHLTAWTAYGHRVNIRELRRESE